MNFIDRLAFILLAWGIFWAFGANAKGMTTATQLMLLGTFAMLLGAAFVRKDEPGGPEGVV